jgi:hypothetical protein
MVIMYLPLELNLTNYLDETVLLLFTAYGSSIEIFNHFMTNWMKCQGVKRCNTAATTSRTFFSEFESTYNIMKYISFILRLYVVCVLYKIGKI